MVDGRWHDDGNSGDDDDCSGDGDGGGDCLSEAEECSGGGGRREVQRDYRVSEGRQEIAQAIWQFHPPAGHHVVFDAVLKSGWPSAPCLAHTWRKNNNLKPLQ